MYPKYQLPPVMTFLKREVLSDFRSKLEDAIQNNNIFEKETSSFIQAVTEQEYLMDLSLWGVPLLPSKGHKATYIVLTKF